MEIALVCGELFLIGQQRFALFFGNCLSVKTEVGMMPRCTGASCNLFHFNGFVSSNPVASFGGETTPRRAQLLPMVWTTVCLRWLNFKMVGPDTHLAQFAGGEHNPFSGVIILTWSDVTQILS